MDTEKQKIYLFGATGVGKSSLIMRALKGVFSEKYLSTFELVETKVAMSTSNGEETRVICDTIGMDEITVFNHSLRKDAIVYVVVADASRDYTIKIANLLSKQIESVDPDVAIINVINKADLSDQLQTNTSNLAEIYPKAMLVSAKTGFNVAALVNRIVELLETKEVAAKMEQEKLMQRKNKHANVNLSLGD